VDNIEHEILTPEEKNTYHSFRSAKRKLEYFFTRVLWKDFGINEAIHYNEVGRPFLKNGHISISHSRDIIVIAFNKDHPIGIDVEYRSPKISSIKHKFLSQTDKNNEIHHYTFQFIQRDHYVITYCSFGDLNARFSDLINPADN